MIMTDLKIYIRVLSLFSLFAVSGCIEEINVSSNPVYNSAADLLTYLETHGDFINSGKNPAFIDVDQLYGNLNNYLLLDVRSGNEFSEGHIENSINLPLESLIETIESKEWSDYPAIVIISASGQKASYAAGLLRLCGYSNVYSLEYGLGQWNEKFSDVWINARADAPNARFLTRRSYAKPLLKKSLPMITSEDASLSVEELLKQRVSSLLSEIEYQKSTATPDDYEDLYSFLNGRYINAYFICYGGLDLYNYTKTIKNVSPPVVFGSHLRGAVYYNPFNDFKASTYLLTLPVDETIFIYSYNGQRSAYITAYLRLLGYPARSLRFGSVSMFYYRLDLNRYELSFQERNIRNYPFVN
jgi:rhodanese-related sulfurtransferase